MFIGSSVSSAIGALLEAAAKRALFTMKSFYRMVIKDFQKVMPFEDTLSKALICLNPKEQKAYNSVQHCRVVAREMSSVEPKEEVTAGDGWMRYQEFEVTEDDVKLITDKFWYKIFSRTDANEEHLLILPVIVKCALAFCHTNADVGRS